MGPPRGLASAGRGVTAASESHLRRCRSKGPAWPGNAGYLGYLGGVDGRLNDMARAGSGPAVILVFARAADRVEIAKTNRKGRGEKPK